MKQVEDFLNETEVLFALVSSLSSEDLTKPTLFKQWSTSDILAHLHFWNRAADYQIDAPDKISDILTPLKSGVTLRELERSAFESADPVEQVVEWHELAKRISAAFYTIDPKARLKWVGPDMSARSSITARQMETWAHGQAIFDLFGTDRVESDRLKNIVVLGVNTFGWTYVTRKLDVPEHMPRLDLEAPSGDLWSFGDEASGERIAGPAVEFCQVVTQTRNIADTTLQMTGETAKDWMSKAQCFAGPAHAPPLPGARFKSARA